jgi:hypothetical protein
VNYSALLASASYSFNDIAIIAYARTWTAPRNCSVRITLFGGSGSAGARRGGATGGATGGGAGARCTKIVKLLTGDVLTLTPGAGGAANAPGSTGAFDGSDGGDTTVTGPNSLSLTAGGGKKGKASTDGLVALDGGLGGTATGGDENVTGGRGGNIVAGSNTNNGRVTGGGALPVFETGHRGGDITHAAANNCATGGAGLGGHGGDITVTASNAATGGGGAHQGAPNGVTAAATSGGASVTVPGLVPLTTYLRSSGPGATGKVAAGGLTGDAAGPGGGGGGLATQSSSSAINVGTCGAFAGGGSAISSGSAPIFPAGGDGAIYGGSGGVITANPSVSAAKGGDGLIILEVIG